MAKYSSEEIKEISKSPWNFFTKHPRVTSLVLMIILIFGFTSLFNLPRELQPEINLPFGSITTVYPGASPLDVEKLVTDELESAIQNVDDIDQISSTSQFGVSLIMIQFDMGIDLDQAVTDVRSAVDSVEGELPEDAKTPIVSSFESNEYSVVTFSLLSDLPPSELKEIANETQNELEKVSGVSDVFIIGIQDKQIEVNLKPQLLEKYKLTINDVTNAIRGSNLNFPIGEIQNDGFTYGIRIESELESANELTQIPIKQIFNDEGISQTILLRDIASVDEKLEDKDTIARIWRKGNGELKNSISLQIYKQKGGNIVQVSALVKEKMEEMQGSIIPSSIEVHVSNDNAKFIQEDLEIMGKNGITTILLIIVLLFVFLGWKESIIAGLSIPFSMLITFGVLYITGKSLNGIALFSLVFALGLLIDNAVIIIEGIYENLKSGKYTSYGSAIIGIKEFKGPIIAGTLTTVFAFLPMLTISGIMGEFMSVIPITVTTILLASLFVNLTITPTLSAKYLKPGKKRNIFAPLQKWYKKFITNTINSRSKKAFYLIIMTIVMLISFSLPILGVIKSESFPKSDFDYFFVDIEMPAGTIIEDTEALTSKVEKLLQETPEIQDFTTGIGTNAGGALRGEVTTSQRQTIQNIATITANLTPVEEREMKSYEVADYIREEVKKFKGGDILVTDLQGGPPSGAPVFIKVTGPELEKLEEIADDIADILKGIEGTFDTSTSVEQGAGEFNMILDRDKLNFYGIAPVQVAGVLRNALEGTTSSEIRKDGEDYEIIVQYKFPGRENGDDLSLEDLTNININSPVSGSVPISNLVDLEFKQNLTNISHLDTERVVYVSSYNKDITTTEIIDQLVEIIDENPLPKDYSMSYGGELEQIEQSFKDLGVSLLIGLVLIAMLLVLQFKSYRTPFIILLSLPFALTGVFFGLTAMGISISIPSVIGIVGLGGVVVNDAIVLIDQMNNNRKRGMEFKEAIIEGATSRLQPVFLTTATSIFGILPLALTDEIWGSLGFAFIFGLTTQYFLVLLLDPILYSMIAKKGDIGQSPKILLEEKKEFESPIIN